MNIIHHVLDFIEDYSGTCLIIAIGLCCALCFLVGINTAPGTGVKIGQVVKISQQGIFSKTWEAQIIRGGMNGGSGSFGVVPFDFTIEGDNAVKACQEHMGSQTEVLITYRIEGIYSSFRSERLNGGSGYFLTSITPSGK